MKKLLASLFFLLSFSGMMAQGTEPAPTFWDDPISHPLLPVYLVTAMVFVVFVLVLVVALYMLRIIRMLTAEAEAERAKKEGRAYVPTPTLWSRITQQLNASVPVAQEQDIDLGHNFDGIRELDNHLPPWWKWLFVGTVAWGVIYFVIYHVTDSLPLSGDEYANEVALATEQAERLKASQPAAVIDENALEYNADPAMIENGKSVFTGTCVACHRADGGGNTIGPNLTDAYWIHGGSVKNIFSTIKNGAVEKGMPEWGKAMSAKDIRDVAFYIMSIQGSNPANAKAPQGELYTPEPKAEPKPIASDSTRSAQR